MKFKYQLPERLVLQVSRMEEFANGPTQVSARLQNGSVCSGVLISDANHIVAARGFHDLPFKVDGIDTLFQTADDRNPASRGGWYYGDVWGS